MEEKVAIPVFKGRVSPLFDVAGNFAIYSISACRVCGRYEIKTGPYEISALIARLKAEEAKILICGAISRCSCANVEHSGIRLIAGIAGDADEVIEEFAKKGGLSGDFLMPGCGGRGKNAGRGCAKGLEPGCRGQGSRKNKRRDGHENSNNCFGKRH